MLSRVSILLVPLIATTLADEILAAPGGAGAEIVGICHALPGQPENRRVLRVSPSAADRHIAVHGDTRYSEAELCSGVDDDCDGLIDEGFALGEACFAGLGECRASGHLVCSATDPTRAQCSAEPRFPPEYGEERTCSGGLDEDCDGFADCDDPDCAFEPHCGLPGLVDLPIALSQCALLGSELESYCSGIRTPLNPCLLSESNGPIDELSCLEFSALPEQNACWSAFDDDPAVGNLALREIVEGGPVFVEPGAAQVDDGDRTSVVKLLAERMYGQGPYAGNPAGMDRDPFIPGIDSWLVRLPIFECQIPGAQCGGNEPYDLVGAVCFEIIEITGPPDRQIKGRFLCPDDPDPATRYLLSLCEIGPELLDWSWR